MKIYVTISLETGSQIQRGEKVKNKDNRFAVVLKEGTPLKDEGLRQILVDKETGVNYLVVKMGYGPGITPLLDKDGKPVISKTGY